MTSDLEVMRFVLNDDTPKLYKRQLFTLRPIDMPNTLRCFNASTLQIEATLKQDTTFKVVFRDAPFCAKISRQPSQLRSLKREIESLHRANTIRRPGLRIPTLAGLICTEQSAVVGFLIGYIDSRSLASIAIEQVPLKQRRRWFEEIEGSLERLHSVDLIWGDAKPDNVLIDRDENAWLIDFGGGWSTGWVDSNLYDSMEGDKQGLRRMKGYLQLE
jgi:serine/threonine protein kinase